MKSVAVVFLVGLAFTGCVAPPMYEWAKEGASPHERETVSSECLYQVRVNKTLPHEQSELHGLCMKGKGYRLKQVH